MGRNINPLVFTNAHIQRVAPVILGAPAWSVLAGEHFMDWSAFRETVDRRYGLTRRACLRAFFDMSPEPEESTAEFLRRVEDMRARYQVGKEETHRHFVQKLREEDLVRLDELADVCALLGAEGDEGELDWDQLLRLADHRTTHAPMSRKRAGWKVTGFGRPPVAEPAPGAVAARPARAVMVDTACHSTERQDLQLAVSQPCELCMHLGRTMNAARHTLATCWANPQNPNHKPDIARIRLLECRHGGVTIHPCMAELDKQVARDTPLPEGARPIRPRHKGVDAKSSTTRKVHADQVHNF